MAYSLMSGNAITVGLIVSGLLLLLLAFFGPAIRDWYRSARNNMRTAAERGRLQKKPSNE